MKSLKFISFQNLLYARLSILGNFGSARRGEFVVEIDRNNHLKRGRAREAGQQYCTRSQFVLYFDDGGLVAAMHQYRRRDGTLGASGMPDPKYLRLEDRILKTND